MRKFTNLALVLVLILLSSQPAKAAYHFSSFQGRPPIHVFGTAKSKPVGLSPSQVKNAYHLPSTGGHGTIAIVDAYDDTTIENDLNVFSKNFNLPLCTVQNGCLEKHLFSATKSNSGWASETSLDVEWAHAIAPQAKILLIEAKTPSGPNLLQAIDYAASRTDIVAVSLSWGGAEFPEETNLDSHFVSGSHTVFFASSGDNGYGLPGQPPAPMLSLSAVLVSSLVPPEPSLLKPLGPAPVVVLVSTKSSPAIKPAMSSPKPKACAPFPMLLSTPTRKLVLPFTSAPPKARAAGIKLAALPPVLPNGLPSSLLAFPPTIKTFIKTKLPLTQARIFATLSLATTATVNISVPPANTTTTSPA